MTPTRLIVHQYHHSIQKHDAVTNHMRYIRDALREVGVGGRLLATEIKSSELEAEKFSRARAWDCDLLLVHHSQGNPALAQVLQIEVPKALIYHNITPPEFFAHDAFISRLCDLGRKQLLLLRRHVSISFTASRLNAWELKTLGFTDIHHLPLLDLDREPSPRKAAPRRRLGGKPQRLLFVGKLTAHKNQALLIQALSHLHHHYPGDWRLTLVGGEDPVYGRYLRGLAEALGVKKYVTFAGRVSDTELRKHYRNHDAFVCVSQHEGFCVPIVEAMESRLPIIAWASEGVSETLGSAGLRICQGKPRVIAEVIAVSLQNRACVKQIIKSQEKRLEELSVLHNRERLQASLITQLETIRGTRIPGGRDVELGL